MKKELATFLLLVVVTAPPRRRTTWTMLNQVTGAVEPLPMVESEHDKLTCAEGRSFSRINGSA